MPDVIAEQADLLELRYVLLTEAVQWDANPKQHDIGAQFESITRYGFKDPPKFEPELNGGNGGIVEGNGRLEALRWMIDQAYTPPAGIAVLPDGDWAVPMLFGVDAASKEAAEAYGLDHNNLTLMGGDGITALDIARMYDIEQYTAVVKRITETDVALQPVSVDGDDLDSLLNRLTQLQEETFIDDMHSGEQSDQPPAHEHPYVNLAFVSTAEQRDYVLGFLAEVREAQEFDTGLEALLHVCEAYQNDE